MVGKEKITNANSFPKDWPIKKLADIGSTYGGLTNKSKEDFAEGNSKFITYKNIYNNTFINTNELESVRIYKDEKQNKVKYGDVFFTGSSETPDEVGISSVLLEEVDDVYLNSFCFGFRFNDLKKTIPEFYGYYFRGPVFRNEVYPLAQGSTRFNLSKSEMIKLKVPVPPVKEQYKIAAILSSVDEAIEKTEAIIEQTEKVKKGLMQQLLTKGIGHTKFKKTEIGEIPEGWEVVELQDLANPHDRYAFTGGPFGSDLTAKEYTDEGVQIIQLQNIKEGYFSNDYQIFTSEAKADELLSCNIYPGDIIIAKMAEPVARACIVPNHAQRFVMASDGVRLSVDKERFVTDYVVCAINAPYFREQAINNSTGTTRLRIGLSALRKLKILIPPYEEQQKIADIMTKISQKIEAEKTKIEKLTVIKKGLMQVLLTGKVRVKVDEDEGTSS